MKTLASITTYNSNLDRLRLNVDAIAKQVDRVLIIDNNSENFQDIQDLLSSILNVDYIINKENLGVATALKQAMDYAIKKNYSWVLTLDQDSVCYDGLIEEYKKFTNLPDVGILSCNIIDRNFSEKNDFNQHENYKEIEKCITSASFTNVKAYKDTDGYDTSMFIDGVDWDICYNFRSHGYKIYKINFDGVLHEVGHGRNVKLLGKEYIVYGESPLRNYYSARNNIYLAKKYPEYVSFTRTILREIKFIILIILYENKKFAKVSNRLKGLLEGMKWH
ncbi:glycosyl transferase family 2 [Intestinibaculum porci]|uniref:Glycosyl transferase family 2 n=1 Tax=Intestinibaculum porci TaxID=2487118 RepID=A0A3G9JA91_9FIRM|nr:glycosyltransferase family 2 protein [Intestinibaculum porci]BBH27392.1 glycosyl transferase family 2 [Intestinibaculum porci]